MFLHTGGLALTAVKSPVEQRHVVVLVHTPSGKDERTAQAERPRIAAPGRKKAAFGG